MTLRQTLLAAALVAITCGCVRRHAARGQPGRLELDGPALAQRVAAAELHRQRLRAAGRARQEVRADAGAGDELEADLADGVALRAAPEGVVFHGGEKFTADDVLFTFKRAAGDGSDMKGYTSAIKEVRRSTTSPSTSRPGTVPHPSRRDLARLHHEQVVVRGEQGREAGGSAQGHRERGLVPYQRHRAVPHWKERQPATRTVLVRNFNYWGKVEGNVDEVIFTPIGNDATRVAALLSGEIDVMDRCRCRTSSA